MAGGPGFEPGLTESESVVLPLDDPPAGSGRRKQPRTVNSASITGVSRDANLLRAGFQTLLQRLSHEGGGRRPARLDWRSISGAGGV